MPLAPSARMGPYEIKSVIGAGGMGEVYRAHDTRLNRDVALKVLRLGSAAGADQRTRFEREAHALAALNHPNIVAVYDFGIEEGQPYIVSELVEGESLRAVLDGKPVAPRRLVEMAVQIADALASAHAAGIVHRDLKPENLMLTRDGRVKILDFGLARQLVPGSGDETSAMDATQHVTRDGAVVGTASYMSPEQALGKAVDYRSDQFSFGLILYEMASGKPPFSRPSSVETMAAIVREDPAQIDEKLPAPLKWIIDRCLSKEPEQRYESTRDLYRDLRSLRDHFSEAWSSASSTVLAPVAPGKKHKAWLIPVIVSVGGLVIGAVLAWLLKPGGQDIGHYRYTPFASHADGAVWSPDGKSVAYSSRVGDTEQVFIRYLNSPVPVQITHEPHDVAVVGWSADRNHLVVEETESAPKNKLATVPVLGGSLNFLMDVDCHACALSPDGQTFVDLMRPANSGQPYQVGISHPLGAPLQPYRPAPFATREIYNRSDIAFSPDGKKILFMRTGETDEEENWLLPYPAGAESPRRILTHWPAFNGTPHFDWLPDSRHIVVNLQRERDSPNHLWIADTESDELEPITTGNQDEMDPAVSPDGRSLLYQERLSSLDVASVSLSDGSVQSLISTGRDESMAAWAEHSDVLAWVTNREGPYEIWFRSGGQERPAVTAAQFSDGRNRWFMNPIPSPDGQKLVFERIEVGGMERLWMLSLAGGSPVRVTNAETTGDLGATWSPDGSRLAYIQRMGGRTALMIVAASGDAAPVAIRDDVEGCIPDWSPDGNWITFCDTKGWYVISPDGKNTKSLGALPTQSLVFSKDSRLLYGISGSDTFQDRSSHSGDRAILFSLDLTTLQQKTIRDLGKDRIAKTYFAPGIRFTLTPDGKSLTWVTGTFRTDLWLLQGYRQPGWLGRF